MGLNRIRVQNYRGLADVDFAARPINVLFGPNGSGKSTLLDTLYFFRDCAIRGVEVASSERDHGIGLLWDGADNGSRISVELGGSGVTYGLSFSLAAGRIEPFPGERLFSDARHLTLIDRRPGAATASLFHAQVEQTLDLPLRDPDKLSLGVFLDFNHGDPEAGHLDRLLHFVRLYHSRSFRLHVLKRAGSESSHQTRLWDLGDNAWAIPSRRLTCDGPDGGTLPARSVSLPDLGGHLLVLGHQTRRPALAHRVSEAQAEDGRCRQGHSQQGRGADWRPRKAVSG